MSRSPRTNAEVFRSDGVLRRCFNYCSTDHLVQVYPSRPPAPGVSVRFPSGRLQAMSEQDGLSGAVFTMRESSGRSPVILRPQGRPFPATSIMDLLGSSFMGAAGGDTVLQVTDPPSLHAALQLH